MELKDEDLKIEVRRDATSHGGQTVGTLDMAVKITHIPTGLSATCGAERSQLQNKARALAELEIFVEKYGKPQDITLNKRKYRTPKPKGRYSRRAEGKRK